MPESVLVAGLSLVIASIQKGLPHQGEVQGISGPNVARA